jgi:hypothetical protein
MATYKLPYRDPYQVGSARPYLAVRVIGRDGASQNIPGLLDSGADMTCLPHYYAKLLGFSPDDLVRAEGHQASGMMPMWTLQERACEAHVVGLPEPVFPLRPSFVEGNVIPLWGRGDFFRVFAIAFDEAAQEFSLTPGR